jgi:hypothetical protein
MNGTLIRSRYQTVELRSIACLILLFGLVLTGCVTHTHSLPKNLIPLKAATVAKPALLNMLKTRSMAVKTLIVNSTSLSASRLLPSDKVKDYGSKLSSGTIIVERPNQLFLEVDYLGTTMVDMVADDAQYKIAAYPKHWFGVANVGAPVDSSGEFPFNLRPSHILDALFVDGERFIDDDAITKVVKEDTESQPDGVHSFYVICFSKGSAAIVDLWFDRTLRNPEVTRKKTYTEDGRIESDVHYSEYEMVDSILFPKLIVIQRPLENYSLEMKLNKLELNKPVKADAFELDRPEGFDDFNPTTGKVTKRP